MRLTPWDERSLGLRTAELVEFSAESAAAAAALMTQVQAWMVEHRIDYSFGRIDARDPHLKQVYQDHGYQFIETSLRMSRTRTAEWPRTPAVKLVSRPPTPEDMQALAWIAVNDFHHGRFLEDPCLESEACRTRTVNWLRDLESAGQLRAMLLGHSVVGFAADTTDPESKTADLILYGVSSDYPMLAMPLWIDALNRLNEDGARRYQAIVSAANTGVMNLYSRLGFQVASTYYGFRKLHAATLS